MTTQQVIQAAAESIEKRDAEILLRHVLVKDHAWLRSYPDFDVDAESTQQFFTLVERRAAHVPLQYLTGHQEFYGLDLEVTPDVLIPRPETERLVEAVLAWQADTGSDSATIVDVGTGSGAIALALATHLPGVALTALDLSPAALAVARGNAKRLGLESRIRFLRSDLLAAPLAEGFSVDVVVSNPPYVPWLDAPEMQPEVRDFEPHLALFAEENGLAVYRRLIPEAFQALRSGGLLALEIGFGQGKAMISFLHNWHAVRLLEDYAGIPRVVLATRP